MWIGKGDHPVASRHPSAGGEFLNPVPIVIAVAEKFPSYGGVPEGRGGTPAKVLGLPRPIIGMVCYWAFGKNYWSNQR